MSVPRVCDTSKMNVVMEGEGVEVRRAEAGSGMSLVWIKWPRGFDFGPALKDLPQDMCSCEHWGVITSGSMDIVTHDGHSFSLTDGQALQLLPGHLPAFPEDCS